MLYGKYLTPPRVPSPDFSPAIVVRCFNSKVEKNYIAVGAVTDTQRGHPNGGLLGIPLEARKDGKRWFITANADSTDFSAVYFFGVDLANMLKAHQVIVGVPEYLRGDVVMQFDMPDPSPVCRLLERQTDQQETTRRRNCQRFVSRTNDQVHQISPDYHDP